MVRAGRDADFLEIRIRFPSVQPHNLSGSSTQGSTGNGSSFRTFRKNSSIGRPPATRSSGSGVINLAYSLSADVSDRHGIIGACQWRSSLAILNSVFLCFRLQIRQMSVAACLHDDPDRRRARGDAEFRASSTSSAQVPGHQPAHDSAAGHVEDDGRIRNSARVGTRSLPPRGMSATHGRSGASAWSSCSTRSGTRQVSAMWLWGNSPLLPGAGSQVYCAPPGGIPGIPIASLAHGPTHRTLYRIHPDTVSAAHVP